MDYTKLKKTNARRLHIAELSVKCGIFVLVIVEHQWRLVTLFSGDTGGRIGCFQQDRREMRTSLSDKYGNGVVGAWTRKGKGAR
jgi:hypothetical protein